MHQSKADPESSDPNYEKYEDVLQLFETYFTTLKVIRDLEGKILGLESREEKLKAYKEYFEQLKRFKELQVDVEEYLPMLRWL